MEQDRTAFAALPGAPPQPASARAPRPRAEYRWTPGKARAFIEALAQHGKVAAAARGVGMTRQSAYKLKARVPQVADVWERAQAIGRARRRGERAKVAPAASSAPPQGDASGQGDTSGAAR